MGERQIPVIEIEAFRLGRQQAVDVSARVRNACEAIGFFFDRTPEENSKIGRTGTNFGGPSYTPFEAESLTATLGQQGLADLKECLNALDQ
jgi:hypothetical protein